MGAAARYEQLSSSRSPFLHRARECAELTIPSLLPKEGHSGTNNLPTPFQGMGARGVNHLSSKLLLTLLPPSSPFFRLMISETSMTALSQGRPGAQEEIQKTLSLIERDVMNEIETTQVRVSGFEAIKQLVVAGNVLLYLPPKGGMKVYRLDRYVVKRSPMGAVLEIIIKESIAPAALPEEVRKVLGDKLRDDKGTDLATVDLYTHVKLRNKFYEYHQEVEDTLVPGSKGQSPVEKSPFIALRWAKIDGEDYGRGHVEEGLGDLRSLEGLTKAIVEGSAAAAKLLFFVNPNANTRPKDVARAPNLAVLSGDGEDITTLQADKFADFRVAQETIIRIEQRLAAAFLLTESIQRNAERVTAEEIRTMAAELEDALGGVYSIFTQEFQLPLVRRIMHQMEQQERLPTLPEDHVKPAIITGMEALGRGQDLNRLMAFSRILTETLGPEVFAQHIQPEVFISRVGTNLGIDIDDLVKSRAQIEQEQLQSQRRELVQQVAPQAVQAASDTSSS